MTLKALVVLNIPKPEKRFAVVDWDVFVEESRSNTQSTWVCRSVEVCDELAWLLGAHDIPFFRPDVTPSNRIQADRSVLQIKSALQNSLEVTLSLRLGLSQLKTDMFIFAGLGWDIVGAVLVEENKVLVTSLWEHVILRIKDVFSVDAEITKDGAIWQFVYPASIEEFKTTAQQLLVELVDK